MPELSVPLSSTANPNVSSTDALVEHLRLTAFVHSDERLNAESWWSDLAGRQPDQRTSRPASGELQDSGQLEDNLLSLSIHMGRVDWLLTPNQAPQPQAFVTQIQSVGIFPDKFAEFADLMGRWLNESPRIIRLAFGSVVYLPVDSREAGYRRLSALLPSVRVDPTGSEDFLYQVNRPKASALPIPGLRINRLAKWSVAYVQRFRIAFPVLPQQQVKSMLGDRRHACRIELDISTPANLSQALPNDQLVGLFHELVSCGSEIVRQGDIA